MQKNNNLTNNNLIIVSIVAIVAIVSLVVLLKTTTPQNTLLQGSTNDVVGSAYARASTYCTDSDNGLNYYLRGTTSDLSGSSTDSCYYSTSLIEYYCKGNSKQTMMISCEYGCSNGACKRPPAPSHCSDSDGGINPFKKGVVNITPENKTYVDYCRRNYVLEYYCSSENASSPSWQYLNCGNQTCVDGRCI